MSSSFQETTKLFGAEFTRERLRFWGVRSGLSILDQGLISGASFLLNLFLARWLTGEAYGAFAVAFATFLFLSGYHNVLLIEPMTVLGPAKYEGNMSAYFAAQLKLHAIVGGALCALLLMASGVMRAVGVQRELLTATVGSALALPFLLLLWLVRRMCYVVQNPSIAACSSLVYISLMLAGILVLRAQKSLSPFSTFLWIGAASVIAAVWPLSEIGILRAGRAGACPLGPVIRESWNYGRWLVASTTLLSVASQAQTYIVAALIGLSAAGVLRAMQIPALVMTQVVTAVAILVLPTMSYDFGLGRMQMLRRKAMLSTSALTVMAMFYLMTLWVFAKPTEHILYGGKFAAYAWLIPLLGLVPVCTGFTLGFSMALRALQKPHYELLANAIAAPVGLITALAFVRVWGIAGAGISLVTSFAAIGAVLCWSFIRLPANP